MQNNNNKETPTIFAERLISEGVPPDEVLKMMQKESYKFASISEVLNGFLGKKNMSVEVLAGLADLNPASIYKIINGQRNPGRNALLRIAISLALNIDETQSLLKNGNCAALSGTRPRDVIIMHGIKNEQYLDEINETLKNKNFPDLNTK